MNSRLRFSLGTLCLLVLAAAIGIAIADQKRRTHLKRELARSTPIEWMPFEQKLIDEKLSNGQSVLVVYYSHWKDRPLWRLDTEEMRLALFDKNVATFSGNAHLELIDERGISQARNKINAPDGETWFGAVYIPDGGVRTFKWIPDADEFALSAIKTVRTK